VPLAYLLDALTLTQLYVVGFAVGVFTVFFDVSYQSYLPSLVRREQLTEANGKLEVSRSAAQTAGPGVAGGLVSLLTAPYAILADSLSFVASALFVTRIQREELLPDADAERGRLRTEIADGLRFVLRHPILRWNLVYVGLANFFGNVMFSIFLVYAVRDLGLTAATIGLIGSLGNVGLLGGALVAPRLSSRFGAGPVLIATAAASGWSLLLIPLASGDLAIPLLVASGLGFGFCVVVYNVTGISLMQAITPDRMLGRMNASKVHRVGRDPARNVARRRAGIESRVTRDSVDRRHWQLSRFRPLARLAHMVDQDHCRRRGCPQRDCDRCLSYPRSKPGCGSSIRSCPHSQSSGQVPRTSRR